MMHLYGANDVLRMVTTTAANIDIVGSHVTDTEPATSAGVRQSIGSATTTTLAAAPGTGLKRNVYSLCLRNRHASLANTITLQIFDGTTAFEVFKVTLAAGEQALYDGLVGWRYISAQGMPRTASSAGSMAPMVGVEQSSVLAADVINNNSVANSIANVTGLSFPVIAGGVYEFGFLVDYTAAATTTGSRWTINGPAFSRLSYGSQYSLSTTGDTFNNLGAYDLPAAANASSALTTGNIARIKGLIQPSVDGDVVARFASEIANSAITAKRGSRVRWMQVA
jgi:hypothetical protein